jgi:nucleoid DNA-binding protein
MNRRDLVTELADRTESDKRSADTSLQALIDIITDTVAKGEAVSISGFAKFARVDRAARTGRNPQTGEPIQIKASRRARITPLKAFKDAVLVGKRTPAKKSAKKSTAKKSPASKGSATRASKKKSAQKSSARR